MVSVTTLCKSLYQPYSLEEQDCGIICAFRQDVPTPYLRLLSDLARPPVSGVSGP